jgi:hypothetical protein
LTPTNAFAVSFLVFAGIPILILAVGTILFLAKPTYAKIVGLALTNMGAGELVAWVGITGDITAIVNFLYLLTLLVGVSSLAYAYRAQKN